MSNIVSSDPVADMLTRIRNAIAVSKSEVSLPYSKQKDAVARVLAANGFIDRVTIEGEGTTKSLRLTLYEESTNARITEIRSLSTPGRRLYVNAKEIPSVKRGRGIVIISTSKGLMTGTEAKVGHIGGELLCEVY